MSQRVRLTLIAAGSTGLLLLIVFVAIIGSYRSTRMHGAATDVDAAIRLATAELKENPAKPDLGEIAAGNPEVSVAIIDKDGKKRASVGVPKLGILTGAGIGYVDGAEVIYRSQVYRSNVIEAAIPLATRRAAILHLEELFASLWPLFVAIVAVISYLASRSTFLPLERISRQAEAFSLENLSARISGESGEYAAFADRLNGFLQKLETSVRREERFIADAAHELRTPLAVLRSRAETCLLNERSGSEYRDALREVLSETDRLTGLVEMLLQSATVAEGDVPPLDLQTSAEQAHARWVDRFAESGVELALSTSPAAANLMPREMDVILDNLLSNALKASPQSTTAKFSVAQSGKLTTITVEDEGTGVPDSSKESIFERFTRLDEGRNRDAGGFGIGLAVCRRVANGRGGRIYVAPSHKGAKFVVEFKSPERDAKNTAA